MNISSFGNSGLGLQISDTKTMNAIDVAMLKKSLDTVETTGDMITQMMERSVNPNIGANIDIRLQKVCKELWSIDMLHFLCVTESCN